MSTEKKARERRNGDAGDHTFAMVIRDSANQIWLAGLGAYARAEEEGSRLFDNLVTMGERVETRAKDQVVRPIRAAERKAGEVRDTATGALSHLRHAFERRVGKILNALQIPTSRDVEELTTRVEELTVALERLERREAARRKDGTAGAKSGRSASAARPRKKAATAGRSAGRTRTKRAGAGRARS
jgi:poly(hydroxyalkanoate) granule-associated protein